MKKTVLLLLFLGQTLIAFAQKPQALELQKLKANLAVAKHDTARILAYIEMGVYFRDSTDYPDSALVYGLKAGQLAEQYPHYSKTPRVWNTIGLSYKKLHNLNDNETVKKKYFDLAEKYFKKCMYEAKKVGNLNQMAAAWFYLSDLYMESSKKYDYFKTSFELINYLQKKTSWNSLDSMILRKTYNSLCIELDYEIGSKKQNEYLLNYKKFISNDSFEIEQLQLLEFEQHAFVWKKKDEKRLLEEYHQYKKTIKTKHYNDELDQYLAQYYFSIQEYEKSFQLMAKYSPQNYDKLKIMPNAQLALLGIKYMIMGKSAYMLNRNQEAIQYLNKAIHDFNPVENSVSMENEQYTALLYLGKAYKKAGNYKQALACNEQADIRYKQMHNVGIQALMAENDVQLEEIKQEKKLHEARTQTLLKEQEIEIQKKQKYVVIGLLALTLLVALWAFYNFQKKNELSKRLETKNQLISQQAEELAESNQLKDKIFALLSHDLRSPINRLIVALGLSIENQRMALMHELYNVQGVLNNVLYWSSMQVKGIKPHLAEVHLKLTIDSVLKEFEHLFQEKQLTSINAIGSEVMLVTDETYLKIILRNLINNAIKFTEPQGFVHINYQKHAHKAMLIVKDTGIGMNAQKIATLFHYPVATAGTNREMGSGLGLSLCYEMVKQLKGKLQVYSQEGHGTKVAIELPI